MASRIDRPRVLANFKATRSVREKAKRTKPSAAEKRDGMSDAHLAAIRKCPCVACLPFVRMAGEAHHLKHGTGERGAGMRSTDRWAVPLCRDHHEDVERAGSRNEPEVFAKWGIVDAMQLASDLWRATPSAPAMTKILIAHKGKS